MCGETRIPRDMCAGKHATQGNTYHYDTGPGKNSYCSGKGHVIEITNEIRSFMDLEIL